MFNITSTFNFLNASYLFDSLDTHTLFRGFDKYTSVNVKNEKVKGQIDLETKSRDVFIKKSK